LISSDLPAEAPLGPELQELQFCAETVCDFLLLEVVTDAYPFPPHSRRDDRLMVVPAGVRPITIFDLTSDESRQSDTQFPQQLP
jgi:hypothetical protein